MARISAVVVTFNRPDLLKRCLESIQAQTIVPDEICVIDNSPSKETGEMVGKYFPSLKYRQYPDNIGSEGGYYEGLKMARENSDYIWLLDDDCVADNNALEELLKWAESLKGRGKLGAVRSAREWDHGDTDPILEIKDIFAWRGTLAVSDAVMDIGLPQKDFFLYGGDIEYGLRMRSKGYHLYLVFSSRISSLHFSSKEQKSFCSIRSESYGTPFRIYYAYRNEVWTYRKYNMLLQLVKVLLHGVKSLGFYVLNGESVKAKAIFRAIVDGFRNKLGKSSNYKAVKDS